MDATVASISITGAFLLGVLLGYLIARRDRSLHVGWHFTIDTGDKDAPGEPPA